MDQVIFKAKAYSKLIELKEIIDSLEGLEPKADAAACSPAVEPVRLPRSPDRVSLAELKGLVIDAIDEIVMMYMENSTFVSHLCMARNRILQQIDKLDQGPAAQCPVEYTECELYEAI